MRNAKNSDSRSQEKKCVSSNEKDREQKRKKQVSSQISDVKTESIKSIIAKMRLLSDVNWDSSEESWDENEKSTKSSDERDKEDEKKSWKLRKNERLFMNWKSGDELCQHAFPNLRERQTRMRKHQQVNYSEKSFLWMNWNLSENLWWLEVTDDNNSHSEAFWLD